MKRYSDAINIERMTQQFQERSDEDKHTKAKLGLDDLRFLVSIDVVVVRLLAVLIGESVDGVPAVETSTLRGNVDDGASRLPPKSATSALLPVRGKAGCSPVGMDWGTAIDTGGELFEELAVVGVKGAVGLSSEREQAFGICVDFLVIFVVLEAGGVVGGDESRVEVLCGGDVFGNMANHGDVDAGELEVFSEGRGHNVIAFLIVIVIAPTRAVGPMAGSAENTAFYLGGDTNASDSAVDDSLENFMTVGVRTLVVAVEEVVSGSFGGSRRLGAGAVDGSFRESKDRLNWEGQVLT